MKYVHFLTNSFNVTNSTEVFSMTYMVVSETRQLVPGHYTMTPVSYDQAKAYADKIGAEFIGCRLEQPPVNNRKQRKAETVIHGGRGGGKSQVNIPLKALDDARRIQGKGKYNTFTNFCYGDGYFARSCIDKYGERVWEKANEIVRGEPK